MLFHPATDIRPSEITPRVAYMGRRRFMTGAGSLAVGWLGLTPALAEPFPKLRKDAVTLDEKPTSFEDVTHYNNFYEYGTDKDEPAKKAPGLLKPRPWTVSVTGECAKPGTVDIDDVLRQSALEERIYRHRCVEGWSMVIPWVGVPLGPVLQRFEPSSKARFVAFTTLDDATQMPGLRSRFLFPWPYSEGLRIDEAMHPLAFLAVGLYGEPLPAQNGAPLRLAIPWKYGFKGIKSIVAIRFVETRPPTFWNTLAPREYGFYSNVNPAVDHPRWSQANERRIGEFFKRKTLPFNGYAYQVGQLYAGMDLKKHY